MGEIVTMFSDQGTVIRENIVEGIEFLRDKTILVAETSIEDRPKILEDARKS